MNRISQLSNKTQKLLSVYFTAGYPIVGDTVSIINQLQDSGVGMIEIGLPFSDPLADGPTIQKSSAIALQNGMTTELLFDQLQNIRETVHIPLLIMGYFNPILQFGVENFCKKCADCGIDGLIIPDLPAEIYDKDYRSLFEKYGLSNIFLITPQTSDQRIKYLDSLSRGFLYIVSSAAVTGNQQDFGPVQLDYFARIAAMNLQNPIIAGFGIHDRTTFEQACISSNGAIVGSSFIKNISQNGIAGIDQFVHNIID